MTGTDRQKKFDGSWENEYKVENSVVERLIEKFEHIDLHILIKDKIFIQCCHCERSNLINS